MKLSRSLSTQVRFIYIMINFKIIVILIGFLFFIVLNELKNTEDWDTIHSSHLTSILIDYFINKLLHFGNESSVTIIGLIR